MNQRLVESVAQTILSMSGEERQLLESLLSQSGAGASTTVTYSALETPDKLMKVAELAQDIRTYEEKYAVPLSGDVEEDPLKALDMRGFPPRGTQTSAYSFFRSAPSLQLEGPEDWSTNVDHYLYGTPKVQDD